MTSRVAASRYNTHLHLCHAEELSRRLYGVTRMYSQSIQHIRECVYLVGGGTGDVREAALSTCSGLVTLRLIVTLWL